MSDYNQSSEEAAKELREAADLCESEDLIVDIVTVAIGESADITTRHVYYTDGTSGLLSILDDYTSLQTSSE